MVVAWAWVAGLAAAGVVAARITGVRWGNALFGIGGILLATFAGLYYPLRAGGGDASLLPALAAIGAGLFLLGGLLAFRRRGQQHRDPWARAPGSTRPAWWRGRRL